MFTDVFCQVLAPSPSFYLRPWSYYIPNFQDNRLAESGHSRVLSAQLPRPAPPPEWPKPLLPFRGWPQRLPPPASRSPGPLSSLPTTGKLFLFENKTLPCCHVWQKRWLREWEDAPREWGKEVLIVREWKINTNLTKRRNVEKQSVGKKELFITCPICMYIFFRSSSMPIFLLVNLF